LHEDEPEENNQTGMQAHGIAGNYQNFEGRSGSWDEQRGFRGGMKLRGSEPDDTRGDVAGMNVRSSAAEGTFGNNKGNWMSIQRQLTHLERQQANIMNMLQVWENYSWISQFAIKPLFEMKVMFVHF
jgi:hypothetical protein